MTSGQLDGLLDGLRQLDVRLTVIEGRLAALERQHERGVRADGVERASVGAVAAYVGPGVSYWAGEVFATRDAELRAGVAAVARTARQLADVLRRSEGARIGNVTLERAGRRTRAGQPWYFAPTSDS